MTSKKSKDNNDLQLFKEEMQDVQPISNDRITHSKKRIPKKSIQDSIEDKQFDQRIYSTEHVPDCEVILRFDRPGLQKAQLKQLRQGKMDIEASLDLHGFTAEQSRSALIEFMLLCKQEKLKTVRIVHGKGFGSSGKLPVIKPLINKWLQETPEVLAFSSAQPKDGGTGAVYVLLKRDK